MSNLVLSGFDVAAVNGVYTTAKNHDGYPFYTKTGDANYMVIFREEWGPYCFAEAYYIVRKLQEEGAIPITVPLYKNEGTDPETGTWVDMDDVGAVVSGSGDVLLTSSSSSESTEESSSSSSS